MPADGDAMRRARSGAPRVVPRRCSAHALPPSPWPLLRPAGRIRDLLPPVDGGLGPGQALSVLACPRTAAAGTLTRMRPSKITGVDLTTPPACNHLPGSFSLRTKITPTPACGVVGRTHCRKETWSDNLKSKTGPGARRLLLSGARGAVFGAHPPGRCLAAPRLQARRNRTRHHWCLRHSGTQSHPPKLGACSPQPALP
jgi:hypothetical protein